MKMPTAFEYVKPAAPALRAVIDSEVQIPSGSDARGMTRCAGILCRTIDPIFVQCAEADEQDSRQLLETQALERYLLVSQTLQP